MLGGAAVLALLAGCGSPSADLFEVKRSGSVPGARLDLVVNDGGTVRCNGGTPRALTDPQLLTARSIQEELVMPAGQGLSLRPGPRSVFSYLVRSVDGTVRFSDDSARQPLVFHQLAFFTLQLAQDVCRLAR
jgi:hypothetical protein